MKCDNCGEQMQEGMMVVDGRVCKACYAHDYTLCLFCTEQIHNKHMFFSLPDSPICSRCYEERVSRNGTSL